MNTKIFKKNKFYKGCRCAYCGIYLTIDTCTVDHIFPKSLGGQDIEENFTFCCYECNSLKSSIHPTSKKMVDFLASRDPNRILVDQYKKKNDALNQSVIALRHNNSALMKKCEKLIFERDTLKSSFLEVNSVRGFMSIDTFVK